MSSKMNKIKYQKRRVGSCFNRVIELNRKRLILKRFVSKMMAFMSESRKLMLKSSKIKKIKYQKRRVASSFNRVIEMYKNILILKRFVTKKLFVYVIMTTELFLEYFCNIECCCL